MSAMTSLDEPLNCLKSADVPQALRDVIIDSLWRPDASPKRLFNGESGSRPSLDVYFRYFSNQCRLIALHDNGRHVSVRTFKHILDIVRLLKKENLDRDAIKGAIPKLFGVEKSDASKGNHTFSSKPQLLSLLSMLFVLFLQVPRQYIKPSCTGAFQIADGPLGIINSFLQFITGLYLQNIAEKDDISIDLAARLLLMMQFGNLPWAFSGRKELIWTRNSLEEFLHDHFFIQPVLGHDKIKLEKTFNARNLQRIAGIEIEWTNNLADHLRMMNDDKKVAIFQHPSFLEYQQQCVTLSFF